jgi:hypothetical protein
MPSPLATLFKHSLGVLSQVRRWAPLWIKLLGAPFRWHWTDPGSAEPGLVCEDSEPQEGPEKVATNVLARFAFRERLEESRKRTGTQFGGPRPST